MQYGYYRVVGFGLCGYCASTPAKAWESYHCEGQTRYGYGENEGTAIDAHAATLIEATTLDAANAADRSQLAGTVRGGRWRAA